MTTTPGRLLARGLAVATVSLLAASTATAGVASAAPAGAGQAAQASPSPTAPSPQAPLSTALWPKFREPREVYVASTSGVSDADLLTATTLQGVYNGEQHPGRLYLIQNGEDQFWLTQVPRSIRQVTITPPSGETLLQTLLARFGRYVKGAIVTDPSNADTTNLATTMAGIDDAIVISPSQETEIASYGIPVLYSFDTAAFTADTPAQTYEWGITNLLPQTSTRLLVMLPGTDDDHIRDYSVATHAFIFWLTSTEATEKPVLNTILAHTPANTPVLGYVPDENPDVADLSENGHFLNASDLLSNASFWASIPSPPFLRQKTQPAPLKAEPDTAYVAFLGSDGDNIQYMQNDLPKLWQDGDLGAVPMGWTVAPGSVYLDPAMLEYYYRNLPPDSELDSGPSGIGYTSDETGADLTQFAELTGEILAKDGLHTADSYEPPLDQAQYAENVSPPLAGISQDEPLIGQQLGPTYLLGQTSGYINTSTGLYCVVQQQAQTVSKAAPLFLDPLFDSLTLTPPELLQIAQSLALAARSSGYKIVFTTPTELELTAEHYYEGQERGLRPANAQSKTGAQVLAEPSAGSLWTTQTPQVTGTNLVLNPSGADGTSGWGTDGGSLSATTYDGDPALHWTSDVTNGQSYTYYHPKITLGDTYTYTLQAAGSGQVYMDLYNGSEDETTLPVQLTSNYQTFAWTMTIPDATPEYSPSIQLREVGAGPVSAYIRDASVSQSTSGCGTVTLAAQSSPTSLVAGDSAPVTVLTANQGGAATTASVSLGVPKGWSVTPASTSLSLAAGQSAATLFTVTPPAGAPGTATLRATASYGGGLVTSQDIPAIVDTPVAVVGDPGDTSNNQFALAPEDYGGYLSTFPDDVDYVYGTSDPATDWSYIQPGPRDPWGDSKAHTFTFQFSLSRAPSRNLAFASWLLDTDLESVGPPTVDIGLNGTSLQSIALPGGGGDGYHWDAGVRDAHNGIAPSSFQVSLPAADLHTGENSVTITTTAGSWLVYDAFGVVSQPPTS